MKKVTIIGAGIGGLTTAIALKQKGFEVEIFENSEKFVEAGSGINLAINAMQIYKRLGVYEDIKSEASYTESMNACTPKLERLVSANFSKFEKKYGVKTFAIHRARLHKILVEHIGNVKIYLNKKLSHLEEKEGIVTLYFEDGTSHRSEIVIGADGIHSAVRKSIFSNTALRDAEQVCWRGISNAKVQYNYRNELNEAWGNGTRFGFVPISKSEIYWFALINKNKFTTKDIDLLKTFSDYDKTVKNIIQATPKDKILCNEIWDLKPLQHWYSGNVCLLGDSAHATTPNMGQGAVQAIESAMALSICLAEEKTTADAFRRYQKIRKDKANYIVKTSWMIGKMAQSDNSIVCFLRNILTRFTPKFLAEKQSDKTFRLNY